jgi:hypothetical protein
MNSPVFRMARQKSRNSVLAGSNRLEVVLEPNERPSLRPQEVELEEARVDAEEERPGEEDREKDQMRKDEQVGRQVEATPSGFRAGDDRLTC